jgi:hypothetical protein
MPALLTSSPPFFIGARNSGKLMSRISAFERRWNFQIRTIFDHGYQRWSCRRERVEVSQDSATLNLNFSGFRQKKFRVQRLLNLIFSGFISSKLDIYRYSDLLNFNADNLDQKSSEFENFNGVQMRLFGSSISSNFLLQYKRGVAD